MGIGQIALEIISPEKQLLCGRVSWVLLPGTKAPFTVLCNHAAMVSTLCTGYIKWMVEGDVHQMAVKSGFVEVRNNKVTACVEI